MSPKSKDVTTVPASSVPKIPVPSTRADLQSLLGGPLLLEGEDPEVHKAVAAQLTATFKPRDAMEDIYVRDIIIAVWECERLRRAKVNLLHSSDYKGVKELLDSLGTFPGLDPLPQRWAKREPKAVEEVRDILAKSRT